MSILIKDSIGGSISGNAATATALTTKSKGSATQPVYWDSNGKPVACTYSLGKSVPADALFSDTALGKTFKTGVTTASHASWDNTTNQDKIIPTMNFLAYWNGAYNSSNSSNLTYCKHGAFGTAATAAKTDFVAATDIGAYFPRQRMTNPNPGHASIGAIPLILALKAAGKPVYTDPEFAAKNSAGAYTNNSCNVYNNSNNGAVTITNIADNQNSANSSGRILQISATSGTINPGRGGFVQNMTSAAGKIFCQIFRAKIPTGYSVKNAENSMGNDYKTYWMTDVAGTGKWEWYCRITICGIAGTFSGGGHVYLEGSGAVTWYLSYCNTFELSNGAYDGLRTQFADKLSTARTIQLTGSVTGSGSFDGSGNLSISTSTNHSHSYLPLTGGTLTGNVTVHTGGDGRGLVFGTSKLNSLSNQLIWQSAEAIRFGSASWDWNSWAGLKYDSANKIIYLGIPDNVIFNANSAQSGGKLYTPGVSEIYTGNGTNKVWHAGNDGADSGLDADKLDGKQLSDIYAQGYLLTKTTIDASKLDTNTWYPVTFGLSANTNTRIECRVALDSGTVPAWSSHTNGFSVRKIWEVNGSGWGTNEVVRRIFVSTAGFLKLKSGSTTEYEPDPVRGVGQLTNGSIEYVYVRGGGKYHFYVSNNITPVLRTAEYTNNSQSVAPTTTLPAAITRNIAYTSDTAPKATKLATARTISLTGAVTGSTTFDGSANASISTTVNHSHSFNDITDAPNVYLNSGTVTRRVLIQNTKNSNGYISRATIGLTNPASKFSPVFIGVGTNDAGTTFTDYYFSADGSITDSKGYTYLSSNNYTTYCDNTYLKLAGGALTGTLNVDNICAINGNGLLAYKPSGWSYVSASQWGVGSVDIQGVIRSSNAELIHSRGGTNYNVLTSANSSISSSGTTCTIKINGTSKDVSLTIHTHSYLPLSGGALTGNVTMGTSSSTKLKITTAGEILPNSTSDVTAGMYGVYSATRLGQVWSMGTAYKIAASGATTGNLYGLMYFHNNWSNSTTYNKETSKNAVGTYANGHQIALVANGIINVSLGEYVWSRYGFKKDGSSNSYVLLGGGSHVALTEFSRYGAERYKTTATISTPGAWTRVCTITDAAAVNAGISCLINIRCHYDSTVTNANFLVTGSYSGKLSITELSGQNLSAVKIRIGSTSTYCTPLTIDITSDSTKITTARTYYVTIIALQNGLSFERNNTANASAQTYSATATSHTHGAITAAGFYKQDGTSVSYDGHGHNILGIQDVRDATRSPNYFSGQKLTAWFNSTGTPDGSWYSGIHMKGWTNGYTSWELCSYSSTGTTNDYNLYFRSGNNDTWGDWKTILNSKNYTSYCATHNHNHDSTYLKLAGGTLTGKLSTAGTCGTWISGKTAAAIQYNGLTKIDHSSFWSFFNMKSSNQDVITFGGLGNDIGFYGYYAATTANQTDWKFTVNTTSGIWTFSKTPKVTISGTSYDVTTAKDIGDINALLDKINGTVV